VAQEAAGIASEAEFVTQEFVSELEGEMLAAAESQDYERAAELRDRIIGAKKQMGHPLTAAEALQFFERLETTALSMSAPQAAS